MFGEDADAAARAGSQKLREGRLAPLPYRTRQHFQKRVASSVAFMEQARLASQLPSEP